ncbi:MAG: DUF975 family protein [Eubacterium sp.]|nr:DUF975 family protein [Eubacterium sp.]
MNENKEKLDWNVKELKKRNYKNVFKRGIKSYLLLVLTVFVFSFLGSISDVSSGFVNVFDIALRSGPIDYESIDAVSNYFASKPELADESEDTREVVRIITKSLIIKNKDVFALLALNHNYVKRNVGEVVAILIICLFLFSVGLFFIKKTLIIGQRRFYLERRFSDNVKLRRTLAPFRNHNMGHVIRTMICYYIVSFLWSLTIVGGIIKLFQYYCVPYIIAENPKVTWRQARDLSKSMTKGYKWKLFTMHLSCWWLYLLEMVPFVSLLVTTPIVSNLQVEAYLKLRSRKDIDRTLLVEKAFDGEALVDRVAAGENKEEINPEFVLSDFKITGSDFDQNDKYGILDFIAMFFLFSFVGWIWEVGLHIYKDHVFVNRGFMYGPWLPIYGAGGAFIILLLSRYKKNKPKLFVMTMLLCGCLEYLTSFVLDYFQNAEYWNYDKMFMNLNGRVCLAGLIAFAIGGFLGVYILGPTIKRGLQVLGKKKAIILCSTLVALFVIDIIVILILGPNSGKGIGKQFESLMYINQML